MKLPTIGMIHYIEDKKLSLGNNSSKFYDSAEFIRKEYYKAKR